MKYKNKVIRHLCPSGYRETKAFIPLKGVLKRVPFIQGTK
jgi:hypothetical protein